ncbi:hypothetical protein GCM10010172_23980 [Paractinoplanes ferrugineus]|uniref:Uncharacterized protein n=1 Tax=Paractinoplanes ferrugineus TaxID=113564 RepID=A0A919J167_9ACTN|nr:hypothetical protein [Actinoplanes ferrugineus]GIE08691.1 hypothetical protein Afe05nite_05310 [Actinoplanes ferrugineus]
MSVYEIARIMPSIGLLRQRAQSLAVLDAILCPNADSRRYFYSVQWRLDSQLFWMDSGTGDDLSVTFPAGAFVRGFAHESPMSPAENSDELWPGMLDGLPAEFESLLEEPSFMYKDVLSATFCMWRAATDGQWRHGSVDLPETDTSSSDVDGSEMMRVLCEEAPPLYVDFAETYYPMPVSREAVEQIWRTVPLTESLVRELNPSVGMAELIEEVGLAAYPVASQCFTLSGIR